MKISVVERSAAIDQTIEMLEQEERGEVSENEKCRLFSEFYAFKPQRKKSVWKGCAFADQTFYC